MDKKIIIEILEEIGTLLELKGENPFKTRAYFNGARTLQGLSDDVAGMIESGELAKTKGIGKALLEKITELVETGQLKYYEDLKASVPEGLLEMLKIPGMGPKKVKAVHEKLDITTIGELEYACKENRLLTLDGFGKKTQDKILTGIEFIKRHSGRFHFDIGMRAANEVFPVIEKHPDVIRAGLAGSIRRRRETIKDIDIVAATDKPEKVMEAFVSIPEVAEVIAHGETKSSVRLKTGLSVDLRTVSDKEFPYALHHFTGSKEHNTAMRSLAKTLDLKMNEYGLFKGEKNIPCKDETAIFKKLGLEFIEPELREATGEIEAAKEGKLPKLVEYEDLQGVFHCHTNYSDGRATVEQMANAAKELGFKYLGLADHSKSAFYANGLDEKRIKEQFAEIDKANKKLKGFKIFKGIESDILADGSLDYDDEVLGSFDYIVASVHSLFNLTEEEMTRRIVKALENPFTTMLGHPTGRLLLSRDAYPLNQSKVIDAARANSKMIEINANPFRLDLDWRHCKEAKEKGVMLCINPDAHSEKMLEDTKYGVYTARRGWLEKDDVFNTRTAAEVEQYLKK